MGIIRNPVICQYTEWDHIMVWALMFMRSGAIFIAHNVWLLFLPIVFCTAMTILMKETEIRLIGGTALLGVTLYFFNGMCYTSDVLCVVRKHSEKYN